MENKAEKIMVFGVFDGLHDGHLFFLNEAQKLAKNLFIVVTQDEVVNKMKGHFPTHNLFERTESLKKAFPSATIIVGDIRQDAWTPIYEQKPDIVLCGYDQDKLFRALRDPSRKYTFKRMQLDRGFKKTKLHSSLLRSK